MKCFRRGLTRQLYETVRRITGEWKNNTRVMKKNQGQKVSNEDDIKGVWKAHFERVLREEEGQ